jgi:predicted nuclease of predicted toxin-antitoxin system
MKFKIDENLPDELVFDLRQAKYDAFSVSQQKLSGTSDEHLASVCKKEDRILVTLDMDFSDLRAYPPQNHAGIIVLRLTRQDKKHVQNVFKNVIRIFATEPVAKNLWIVEETRIRIRGVE